MFFSLATSKINITLNEEQVAQVRELVAAGRASSVSGFIQHAVGVALFDAAGWRSMLDDALNQTGGPLSQKERAWADTILRPAEKKPSAAGSKPRKNKAA